MTTNRTVRITAPLVLAIMATLAAVASAQDAPCQSCEAAWRALPSRIVPVPLLPRPDDFVWLYVFDPSRSAPDKLARVVVRQESPEVRVVPASVSRWDNIGDSASVTFRDPLSPGAYVAEYFEPGATSMADEVPKASLRFVVTNAKPVEVVEYFNARLGHYFMTADVAEIEKLDAGVVAGWLRTGESFHALPPGELPSFGLPVCRYYGVPSSGLDTHFFSASPDECRAVKTNWPNQWILETDAAFGAIASQFPIECPQPLYRLYNNRPDANHRYTKSTEIRDRMIAEGWVLEAFAYDGPLSHEEPFTMCTLP